MRCLQLLLLMTIVLLLPISGQSSMSVDNTLAETQWRLTSFGSTNAQSPVIDGTTITLKFGGDGKVGGKGGCNSYGGDYQIKNDRLSLSRIISTKRACVQPEAMRQEAQYFEALGSVGKFKRSGGQLTIFYDEERGALNFRAIDSQAVAEARYRLDASKSTFMVRAFSGGLLWFKGHDHLIAVRDFTGEVRLTPQSISPASLQLTLKSDSLVETRDVFTEQQKQIINKELREIVLETAQHPEINFRSTNVTGSLTSAGQFKARIEGDLTMHGVTRRIVIPTQVTLGSNDLRARGEFTVDRSDFKVKATSAFHGMVRVRDKLKFTFDILAQRY